MSDLLEDQVVYKLWVTSRSVERRVEADLQSLGLTIQTAMILILVGQKDACRPKDIAGMLSLTPAAVSRLLRNLEAKGLVETRTRKNDRRESLVSLTPHGEVLKGETAQCLARGAALVQTDISDAETEQLMSTLAKILVPTAKSAA